MKHLVLLTAAARADIAQAQDWYEAKRDGLGIEFILAADDTMERIADKPLAYRPVVENVRRANLDRFPYGIWFRVEEDGIFVLACLHHRRDNPKLAQDRALGLEP